MNSPLRVVLQVSFEGVLVAEASLVQLVVQHHIQTAHDVLVEVLDGLLGGRVGAGQNDLAFLSGLVLFGGRRERFRT